MGKMGAVNHHICVGRIEGKALLEQLGEALIRPFCNSALIQMEIPRFKHRQIHIKEDNDAVCMQMFHCGLAVDGAASRCNDMVSALQSAENTLLDAAQRQIAVLVKNSLK